MFNVEENMTRSTGVGFYLKHRFKNRWSVQVATTLTDHEYASDHVLGETYINGNQVDSAPLNVGNVTVNWLVNSGLSMQLKCRNLAKYYLDPENEHLYPGHDVLDLRAEYQLNSKWEVSAKFS